MSYDLYLRDPVTGECLEIPAHLMHGSNVPCEMVTDEFGRQQLVPTTSTEAYINVTYNYSEYYHGAFPGASSNPENQARYEKDCAKYGITDPSGGIRSLNGLSGAKAIPVLQEMIRRIEKKYKDVEGWIHTEREKVWYTSKKNPAVKKDPNDMFIEYLHLKRDGLTDEQADQHLNERWERHEGKELVCEGETGDYWKATAANAIRPLYQLIAVSQLRPDGVWSEES